MNIFENLLSCSSVKQKLFRSLLEKYEIDFAQLPIPHFDETHHSLLSYIQQSLFFLNQISPDSAAYNIERAIRFKGRLNIPALTKAIVTIQQRHKVLRYYCEIREGIPYQRLANFEPQQLVTVDLSDTDADKKEESLLNLLLAEATSPFDLTRPPLFKTKLYKLDKEDHVLLIVMHHFVIDGLSEALLAKEIKAIYESVDANEPISLPENIIDYADYAIWERIRVDNGYLDKQVAFWKKYLEDIPTMLELPTSRTRDSIETFRGQSIHFSFDEELTSRIKQISEKFGSTLFMTLLAAYQILLQRYSQQKQFAVATAVSHRGRPEIENMIGCFANNVVIKAEFSGDPAFIDFLGVVTENTLKAFANQDLPFEKLVEEIHPERDLSHNPIFQAGFELHQESYIDNLQVDCLDVSEVIIDKGTSMYDLDISMVSGNSRLSGVIEFSTEIFDREFILQMQNHFENLLKSIVEHPEHRLSELRMLTDPEMKMLLNEWCGNVNELRNNNSWAHHLIDHCAVESPGSLAVMQGECSITFQQLSLRSNQIANFLLSIGVRPGHRVGLCADRSPELITWILGILKSGCAYVPLDASYPEERLKYFVDKAKIDCVVSKDVYSDIFRIFDVDIILIDDENHEWEKMPSDLPDIDICPDDIAYIIFTSGSTGNPKGVSIKHRSLTNYIEFCLDKYKIGPDDRALQFSSINFDTSIEEIFPTLCGGATLVLRDDEMISTMETFISKISDLNISILNIPTAYWHELVTSIENQKVFLPACVSKVVIGGEKALTEKYRSWRKFVGRDIPLFNIYGPTETTVGATFINLSELEELEAGELSIGKPVNNTLVYILDEHHNPVPIGVPGELYIGGMGLAKGYYGDPILTDEKFILNPFTGNSDDRLYSTGDKVKFRKDGNIEYIGRIDSQIKIRGFRIEIGEIETSFLKLDSIEQVVITTLETGPGDLLLVAYVVFNKGENNSVTRVRKDIRKYLPKHMIPQHILELEEIPITANGKVDIKSLPSPLELSGQKDRIAPRNSVEIELAKIWADTLHIDIEAIGVHDNFFDIGGNSLASMRVISSVYEKMGTRLNPRTIVLSTLEHIANECGACSDVVRETSEASMVKDVPSLMKSVFSKIF